MNVNDERLREPGEDSETPAEFAEIDDEIEAPAPHGEGLGLVGQLVATLGIAAVLGLLILGAIAALSWLFT
jgi:hypothetical protein